MKRIGLTTIIAAGMSYVMAFVGAATAADYFAGKTITVTVPSGSGGTYHIYCQIMAKHLARHVPGKPTMIVKNRPGAGGAVAAAYMMNVAPKDGTTIAMIAPGSLTVPLYRKVDYDVRKFKWLGSIAARSSGIWVWHTAPVKTLEELKKNSLKMASTGFAAGGSVMYRFTNKTLGTKMDVVYGYKGGGALNIAVERGEAHGRWNYRSGFMGVRPNWIPEKKIVPLIAMGPRDPLMKGVPHIRDLLQDGSVEQKVHDLINVNFLVGQGFYAPPGTPDDVVKILRGAFDRMIADPQTKDDIIKRRIEYSPLSADQIDAHLEHGFALAKGEVLAAFKQMYVKQ